MSNFQTPLKSGYTHITQKSIQREGDWICFNCNNLNFSFRKRCNRCKNQTREQNQQYAQYYRIAQICYNTQSSFDTQSFQPNSSQTQISNPESSHKYSYAGNQTFQFQSAVPKTKRSLSFNQKINYKEKQITQAYTYTSIDFQCSVTDWDLFLNHEDQCWESTCSDSSGQNSQQCQILDYQIQQMVTRIII